MCDLLKSVGHDVSVTEWLPMVGLNFQPLLYVSNKSSYATLKQRAILPVVWIYTNVCACSCVCACDKHAHTCTHACLFEFTSTVSLTVSRWMSGNRSALLRSSFLFFSLLKADLVQHYAASYCANVTAGCSPCVTFICFLLSTLKPFLPFLSQEALVTITIHWLHVIHTANAQYAYYTSTHKYIHAYFLPLLLLTMVNYCMSVLSQY